MPASASSAFTHKYKTDRPLENQETINNPIHAAALYEIFQIASFNSSIDGLEFLF
jgi:hypothetical protein